MHRHRRKVWNKQAREQTRAEVSANAKKITPEEALLKSVRITRARGSGLQRTLIGGRLRKSWSQLKGRVSSPRGTLEPKVSMRVLRSYELLEVPRRNHKRGESGVVKI